MTKLEAIIEMKEGKKITHPYFLPNEWVKTDREGEVYIFEDGMETSSENFWFFHPDELYGNSWELFKQN